MKVRLLAAAAILSSVSVSAYAIPTEGEAATVGGRVHVERQGDVTYLFFPGPVAGVVPWGFHSTFPNLDRLDGRDVEITGVVDEQQWITLTDPDQIKVIK